MRSEVPISDVSTRGSFDLGTEVHACLSASFELQLGAHVLALDGSVVALEEGGQVIRDNAHLNLSIIH